MSENIYFDNYNDSVLCDIADIEKECFSLPWSKNALAEFVKSTYNHIISFCIDGRVAGYITYTALFDEVQIANVAVSKNYRRQHIAFKLLDELIKLEKNNNRSFITLEVRQSNTAAFSLYKSAGFEQAGIRKGFYSSPTEDAVIMNYSFLS